MDYLASLHPAIIHFPIALFPLYALFEASGVILKKDFLSKSASVILVIAIIASLAAVFTGNLAYKAAETLNTRSADRNIVSIPVGLINRHESFATLTVWYYSVLLLVRITLNIKKKFAGLYKYAVVILAVAGILLLYKTGQIGGQLVYRHGVGAGISAPADTSGTTYK